MIDQLKRAFIETAGSENAIALIFADNTVQSGLTVTKLMDGSRHHRSDIRSIVIFDNGVIDNRNFTEGEVWVQRILTDTSPCLTDVPIILMGYDDAFERISRNRACWFLRYFCTCLPITCTRNQLDAALKNTLSIPVSNPNVLEEKWFSESVEYLARIEEYLHLFVRHELKTTGNKWLLALSKNFSENNGLDKPFDPHFLQRLSRSNLKRKETHDMKTCSAVGPVTLLEGAFLHGDIPVETFREGVKKILCKTIGYPEKEIENYLDLLINSQTPKKNTRTLARYLKNKKVLLIDDNPDLWEIALKTILFNAEIRVEEKPFSKQKLNDLLKDTDILFLDLYFRNIPPEKKLNKNKYDENAFGHFILENRLSDFPVLPVILFTTSERADQARHSLEIGADDFISKEVSDDRRDPVKIYREFSGRVKKKILFGKFVRPLWETAQDFKVMGLETIFFLDVINCLYAKDTVFGKRTNITSYGQGIVSLAGFSEANRYSSNKTYHIIKNARNIIAHGNMTGVLQSDLIIILALYIGSKGMMGRANRLCAGYTKYLNQNPELSNELGYNAIKIFPVCPKKDFKIKNQSKSIWKKICEYNKHNNFCISRSGRFEPYIVFGNYRESQKFIHDYSNKVNQSCDPQRDKIPDFKRIHDKKKNALCVYLGSHPCSYLLFDFITYILKHDDFSGQRNMVNLLALRMENLYIRNFRDQCGDLQTYLYHEIKETKKS